MSATKLSSAHQCVTVSNVLLEIRGIHKRFGGVYALRGVSLVIEAGNIYHLLGENGCGKSTLIKIISGTQPPSEGSLLIDGIEQSQIDPLNALKLGIETVYQDLSLIPNLSVAQNVALSVQLVARNGKLLSVLNVRKINDVAAKALAAVNLPNDPDFLRIPVDQLPIATRQLIAIARTIATDARLVIMDEPTTALTQKEVENLVAVVKRLKAQGVAILFVTHKLDECYAIGGKVIVFRDGELIAKGDIADYTKPQLARLMTGRDVEGRRTRNNRFTGDSLMQVNNLSKKGAFQQVSFNLRKGEILGITGLLDSGRNELALALSGIHPSTAGAITLAGQKLRLNTPRCAIDAGIAYVPEDRITEGLFLDKPICHNIFVGSIWNVCNWFGLLSAKKAQDLAEKTVTELHIATPDVTRPVQMLSGGNQQKVLIGRWLALRPKILILHGPTVGVDVGSKETIYRIVQDLSNTGVSVILISDDLPELLQNCDHIALMKKGRLHQYLDAAQIDEAELYQQLIS